MVRRTQKRSKTKVRTLLVGFAVLALCLVAVPAMANGQDYDSDSASVYMNIPCYVDIACDNYEVGLNAGDPDFVGQVDTSTGATISANCYWGAEAHIVGDALYDYAQNSISADADFTDGDYLWGSPEIAVSHEVVVSVQRNGLADWAGYYSGTLEVTIECD
jgi:hypothetical protein